MVGRRRDMVVRPSSTEVLRRGTAVLHPDMVVRPSNTEARLRGMVLLRRHMVVHRSSMEDRRLGTAVRHPAHLLGMAVHRSSMVAPHRDMVGHHLDMGVAETRITAVDTTSITINFVGSMRTHTFNCRCNDTGVA
jgi:hypothetical protein